VELGIVAAVSNNGVIGFNGKLPWPIFKEDMARLHSIIDGHTIIVGKNTMEDIPDTWDCNYLTVSMSLYEQNLGEFSVKAAIEKSALLWPNRNIYFLGGTRIFQEAYRFASKLYLTRIDDEYDGDTYFPRIPTYWARTKSERITDSLIFDEYENVYQGQFPVPVGVF
jgi:dihydrofolate reductase